MLTSQKLCFRVVKILKLQPSKSEHRVRVHIPHAQVPHREISEAGCKTSPLRHPNPGQMGDILFRKEGLPKNDDTLSEAI
jgi:hypothetical protein